MSGCDKSAMIVEMRRSGANRSSWKIAFVGLGAAALFASPSWMERASGATVAQSDSTAQAEKVIEKNLVDCGLKAGTFTVRFEDYLQSIEIVVGQDSGASKNQFACIHRAGGHEIVTFKDSATHSAYADFIGELMRPLMLAEATAQARKLGLLDGFPKRAAFKSLESYARALERHAGLVPGTALKPNGDGLLFDPPREMDYQLFSKKYRKLLAAIAYASASGEFEGFGFVGNEVGADPNN